MSLDLEERLRARLRELVPEVTLRWQAVPRTGLTGFLLEQRTASLPLSAASAERVMEAPPFWSLLWPSGHLLCRIFALSRPLVEGRACVDLGCGSGLAAVALARAGGKVSAVDRDPLSLDITRLHASRQSVGLELRSGWEESSDLLVLGDFLYDEENLNCLPELESNSGEILVADSRLPDLTRPGYSLIGCWEASAVPDLDPHREFGSVRIWYWGDRLEVWREVIRKSLLE